MKNDYVYSSNTANFVFNGPRQNNLICSNKTDQFSIHNSYAKLKYPIGLLTYEEANNIPDDFLKKNMISYTMTPKSYSNSSLENIVIDYDGHVSKDEYIKVNGMIFDNYELNGIANIRPVISLKPRIKYSSGDGSSSNPFLISLKNYYDINIEIKNETEELTVNVEDLTSVEEGEKVPFKITPIKGYKVTSIKIIDKDNNEIEYETTDNKNYTFTMPASDVTIIPSYERVKNAVTVEDNKNTKEIKIEVNDATAVVYEDKVVFTVVPEEGYVVEEIIIKDKNNNKINYKEKGDNKYEFIMPDTDVTIVPKYKEIKEDNDQKDYNDSLINPVTSSTLLVLTIILIIISIGTFIYKKKRRVNI